VDLRGPGDDEFIAPVLDVGTGAGSAAATVALAGRLHPEVEFRQADAECLPSTDAAFEGVVWNHLARPPAAAEEDLDVIRSWL
jgi:hypothetical protein